MKRCRRVHRFSKIMLIAISPYDTIIVHLEGIIEAGKR